MGGVLVAQSRSGEWSAKASTGLAIRTGLRS